MSSNLASGRRLNKASPSFLDTDKRSFQSTDAIWLQTRSSSVPAEGLRVFLPASGLSRTPLFPRTSSNAVPPLKTFASNGRASPPLDRGMFENSNTFSFELSFFCVVRLPTTFQHNWQRLNPLVSKVSPLEERECLPCSAPDTALPQRNSHINSVPHCLKNKPPLLTPASTFLPYLSDSTRSHQSFGDLRRLLLRLTQRELLLCLRIDHTFPKPIELILAQTSIDNLSPPFNTDFEE